MQRLGQKAGLWLVTALVCGGGVLAAYRYHAHASKVDVRVTKARVSDFAISVRTRGEVRSVRSDIITAPQVPGLRIVKLAEFGKPIKEGEVIVEFDAAPEEPAYLEKNARRAKTRVEKIALRARHDGIVTSLPNFRGAGSGDSPPAPFKERDNVWAGAAIAEIVDLSRMRMELKLEEVERGKVQLRQSVKVRLDAIADKEFAANLDWISPTATIAFKGMGLTEKTFPAYATFRNIDRRLKPGMAGTADIVIERQPAQLMIPIRASFTEDGKPAVYLLKGDEFALHPIEVGKRNDTDIVVLKGLQPGETIALETPAEAAKRARKLQ